MAAKQKPTKMVSPRVVVTSPKEEKVKTKQKSAKRTTHLKKYFRYIRNILLLFIL